MDPASGIALAAKTLGSMVSLGFNLYRSLQDPDRKVEKEIQTLLEVLRSSRELDRVLGFTAPVEQQVRCVVLLSSAVGAAWNQHFGPRMLFTDGKLLSNHFEAATQWALDGALTNGSEPPVGLAQVLRNPELCGYYRSLWRALADPALPAMKAVSEGRLIDPFTSGDRAAFEKCFRLAWAEAMSSEVAAELRAAGGVPDSERNFWVRQMLMEDITTWGQRHVVGNVGQHDRMPAMPLDAIYVEPLARALGVGATGTVPALKLIRDSLKKHSLVVITADFGHGKSLTARKLALEAARSYLSDRHTASSELEIPIFVRCQNALTSEDFQVSAAVPRALCHQLRSMGVELMEEDAALKLPPEQQPTLILIDGLDEVGFSERRVKTLFQHLAGQTLKGRRKIVVFSRPHSLPSTAELVKLRIPVLELQPFSIDGEHGGQVGQWLERWNQLHRADRPSLTMDALRERNLHELARTPILLFMMAYTWPNAMLAASLVKEDTASSTDLAADWSQRNRLYEAFFRSIARGKYEQDPECHPLVDVASTRLRAQLSMRQILKVARHDENQTENHEHCVEAMLWLMGRIAWEARCRELDKQNSQLQRYQVEAVLGEELGFTQDSAEIYDGLLLALQSDLTKGSQRILWGHESFREFAIAYYWESQLYSLVRKRHPKTSSPEIILLRGRLLGHKERSIEFLAARLATWSKNDRYALFEWAENFFNDETLEPPSLAGDHRLYLREAALAIASLLADERGVRLQERDTLRSMLISFAYRREVPKILARRLQGLNADLREVVLRDADLEGADLEGANLEGANLEGANLKRAKLNNAILSRARLRGADLRNSTLRAAILNQTDLLGALLEGVTLDRDAAATEGALLNLNLEE